MRNDTRYADVVAGVLAAIAAYAQALDDGRVDDVVATFCADGSCDIPGLGAHAGRDALREAFEKVKPRIPQRHVVVNTNVTEWDEHNAKATSDLVFLLKGESGWAVQLVGRYHDTLRNDDGTWRFARRVAEFVS
jgi:3-phenylpropionate/cinnamic acid dioxygenase small subunit